MKILKRKRVSKSAATLTGLVYHADPVPPASGVNVMMSSLATAEPVSWRFGVVEKSEKANPAGAPAGVETV